MYLDLNITSLSLGKTKTQKKNYAADGLFNNNSLLLDTASAA